MAWLSRCGVWFIGRHDTVRAAPGDGQAWKNALICVDPPLHTHRRTLITDRKVAQGSFDACGPDNPRMRAALPRLQAMMDFIADTHDRGRLAEGGFGWTVAEAARRGEIPREAAIGMLAGDGVAAFDTTIVAIANGLFRFAENPAQWERLGDERRAGAACAPLRAAGATRARAEQTDPLPRAHCTPPLQLVSKARPEGTHFDQPEQLTAPKIKAVRPPTTTAPHLAMRGRRTG